MFQLTAELYRALYDEVLEDALEAELIDEDDDLIEFDLYSTLSADVSADVKAEQDYSFWAADADVLDRAEDFVKGAAGDIPNDVGLYIVGYGLHLAHLEYSTGTDLREILATLSKGVVTHKIGQRVFNKTKARFSLFGDPGVITGQDGQGTPTYTRGPIQRGDGLVALPTPIRVVDKELKTELLVNGSAYTATVDYSLEAVYRCLIATRDR